MAKIASDLRKPDGLVVVPAGEEREFLAPLAIERLWGVGASTRRALADYDVATIGDLAALPEDVLVRRFGTHGARPRRCARRASATRSSAATMAAKSVSHEHTFDVDTRRLGSPRADAARAVSEGVGGRLRAIGVLCVDGRGEDPRHRLRDHHPPEDAAPIRPT